MHRKLPTEQIAAFGGVASSLDRGNRATGSGFSSKVVSMGDTVVTTRSGPHATNTQFSTPTPPNKKEQFAIPFTYEFSTVPNAPEGYYLSSTSDGFVVKVKGDGTSKLKSAPTNIVGMALANNTYLKTYRTNVLAGDPILDRNEDKYGPITYSYSSAYVWHGKSMTVLSSGGWGGQTSAGRTALTGRTRPDGYVDYIQYDEGLDHALMLLASMPWGDPDNPTGGPYIKSYASFSNVRDGNYGQIAGFGTYEWWRRAAVQVLDGVPFIIETTADLKKIRVYGALPTKDMSVRRQAKEGVTEDEDIRFGEYYEGTVAVTAMAEVTLPYPSWVDLNPAKFFFLPAEANKYEPFDVYANSHQPWWDFNSTGTRMAAVVYKRTISSLFGAKPAYKAAGTLRNLAFFEEEDAALFSSEDQLGVEITPGLISHVAPGIVEFNIALSVDGDGKLTVTPTLSYQSEPVDNASRYFTGVAYTYPEVSSGLPEDTLVASVLNIYNHEYSSVYSSAWRSATKHIYINSLARYAAEVYNFTAPTMPIDYVAASGVYGTQALCESVGGVWDADYAEGVCRFRAADLLTTETLCHRFGGVWIPRKYTNGGVDDYFTTSASAFIDWHCSEEGNDPHKGYCVLLPHNAFRRDGGGGEDGIITSTNHLTATQSCINPENYNDVIDSQGDSPTGTLYNANPDNIESLEEHISASLSIVKLSDGTQIDEFPVMLDCEFSYVMSPVGFDGEGYLTNAVGTDFKGFEEGIDYMQKTGSHWMIRSVTQNLKAMAFLFSDIFSGAGQTVRKGSVQLRHKGVTVAQSARYENAQVVVPDGHDFNNIVIPSGTHPSNPYTHITDQHPALMGAVYMITAYQNAWYNQIAAHPNGSLACFAKARWNLVQGDIDTASDEMIDYVKIVNADSTVVTTHKQLYNTAMQAEKDRLTAYGPPAASALSAITPHCNLDYPDFTSGGFCGHSYFYGGGDPKDITWSYATLMKSKNSI